MEHVTYEDRLTNDYFSNDFPGWDYSKKVEIPENPFYTRVPFVEIDMGFDTDLLRKVCEQLPAEQVGKQPRKHGPYQKVQRMKGWECNKFLWNHGNRPTYTHDIRRQEDVEKLPVFEAGEKESIIEEHLKSCGAHFKVLLHMMMQPGAYLRPHRDFSANWPLLYAWVPVTYPKGTELKFYPYGTVTPKFGCIYLFNQYFFTHGIRNTNPTETRHAFIGHLSEEMHDNPEWRQRVIDAINQQYNS